jgi:hypothetical protein
MDSMPGTPDPQTRTAVTQRIIAHVTRGWPRLGEPVVRHRGQYCYVSALLPGYREPAPILRLRYQGSADRWAIGIYLASSDRYTEAELPASFGPKTGTPKKESMTPSSSTQALKPAAYGRSRKCETRVLPPGLVNAFHARLMISLLSVIVYLNFFTAHATERFWPNELRCPWDPESAPSSQLCVIDRGWDWGGLASRGSAGSGVTRLVMCLGWMMSPSASSAPGRVHPASRQSGNRLGLASPRVRLPLKGR